MILRPPRGIAWRAVSLMREKRAMQINGACHCGAIAFEAEVDPNTARICHCTDCQNMSGSLFRANILPVGDSFRVLRGTPKLYIKTAESGNKRAQAFCETCGTGLYAASVSGAPNHTLRVGVIAQRASFKATQQIWCQSALPMSAAVPGLEQRARQT